MKPRRRTGSGWSVSFLHRLDIVCRYLLLSLLWTMSAMLIVTAPAGTHAMLETVQRWSDGDDRPVVVTFIRALRGRVVTTGIQTLPLAGIGVLLFINFSIVGRMGGERPILSTALMAVAFPIALIAVTLRPALLGREVRSIRDAYTVVIRDIVQAPLAAIVVLILVSTSVLIIYIQPLALLIIPAAAARLVLAARTHLIHHTKETTT